MSSRVQLRANGRIIFKRTFRIRGRVQLGIAQFRTVCDRIRGFPGDDWDRWLHIFRHCDLHRFLSRVVVRCICRREDRTQGLSSRVQFRTGDRIIHKSTIHIRGGVQLNIAQFCAFFDTGRSNPGNDRRGFVHFQQNRFRDRCIAGIRRSEGGLQRMGSRVQFRTGSRIIHKSPRNIRGGVQLGRAQGGSISNGCRSGPGDSRCLRGGHNYLDGLSRCVVIRGIHWSESRCQGMSPFTQFCSGWRIVCK